MSSWIPLIMSVLAILISAFSLMFSVRNRRVDMHLRTRQRLSETMTACTEIYVMGTQAKAALLLRKAYISQTLAEMNSLNEEHRSKDYLSTIKEWLVQEEEAIAQEEAWIVQRVDEWNRWIDEIAKFPASADPQEVEGLLAITTGCRILLKELQTRSAQKLKEQEELSDLIRKLNGRK